MVSLSILPLLLSSVLPLAWTADAGAPRPKRPQTLEEYHQAILGVINEIEPLLSQLDGVRAGYHAKRDLDRLFAQRETLRGQVQELLSLLIGLGEDFDQLRRDEEIRKGSQAMQDFFRTGGIPTNASNELNQLIEMGRFSAKISAVRQRAQAGLKSEEDAHRAVQRSIETQRRWITGSIAASSLMLAFVFFLLWRSRSRADLAAGQTPVTLATPMPNTPLPSTPTATPRPLGGPHTTPLPAVAPGQILGGSYRVVKELAKGSLGTAYEAMDLTANRRVVIKRIRDELHRSEKDLERFLTQARGVAALKHANLAEVYSVFLEADRVHLAVELVPGPALSQFLEAGNRVNLTAIKRVIRQVGTALQYAHDKKVLHGDLTPANIFVTREGLVKVSDFGIGLEARKVAARLSWTEPIGSPAYMAPEQELGSMIKESDFYSLGVILYEMATGRLPFDGPNFLAQKREMRYAPASKLAADIPKEIDPILRKALQPEPQLRFHSAEDFCKAVEALPEPAGPKRAA
ncbi:MAG: serine/threonine-protein kinase [Elusimicrobiota bacterium]